MIIALSSSSPYSFHVTGDNQMQSVSFPPDALHASGVLSLFCILCNHGNLNFYYAIVMPQYRDMLKLISR